MKTKLYRIIKTIAFVATCMTQLSFAQGVPGLVGGELPPYEYEPLSRYETDMFRRCNWFASNGDFIGLYLTFPADAPYGEVMENFSCGGNCLKSRDENGFAIAGVCAPSEDIYSDGSTSIQECVCQ